MLYSVAIHFNVLVGKILCATTYKDEIESKKSGVAQSISSNSGYNGQPGFCESKIAIIFCYKFTSKNTDPMFVVLVLASILYRNCARSLVTCWKFG